MSTETREWRRFDRSQQLKRFGLVLVSTIVFVASWRWLELDIDEFGRAPTELADLLGRSYPPHWEYAPEIVAPMIETIHIAAIGTVAAIIMALPVAFISAENTTPNDATYSLGKLIVTFTRSVHTIVWALLFVVMFGPGALAGTFAIAVRSIGFIGKLLGEEIEEIEFAQLEAISATGASPFQSLLFGIVPQIKPALIGISVYRWDINVRGATILGFVGAGGIGVQLYTAVDSFAWRTVSLILLAILAVVLLSEVVSAYARGKVR